MIDQKKVVVDEELEKRIDNVKLSPKTELYESDICNAELVMDAHCTDPFKFMRIQKYDAAPMAKDPDDVVIRVEATTVCDEDCRIRDGTFTWKLGQKPSFPMCPGLDCVGIVTSAGELAVRYGIDLGDRVAALSLNGCTSKYIMLKFDEIVKVPDNADPKEAVAVVRVYTAAFQALMMNLKGSNRYARKPMEGDKVLIVGPCSAFEKALVELSFYLGAKRVYYCCISSNNKSHDTYIRMLGAKPLSSDPEEWMEELEGKIDVAIDSMCVDRYECSYSSLKEDGILIATGMRELLKSSDFVSTVEKAWVKTYIAMDSKCAAYDGVIETFQDDKKQFMKDLIFLYNILEKGKIKPKISTVVSMKKVAAAQERLDLQPESMERKGIIVVEPWLLDVEDE